MPDTDANLEEVVRQRTLELAASEARFHNIVSISTEGILIVGVNGLILFANAAALSLFGRKAEEVLGKEFGFPIVAGDATELDVATREGKPRIAEMRVVGTEWEGNPAYLATLRDVTERKRAEVEIQRLNRDLIMRAGDLEAANKELETFNYSVAHDLRQPLNMISGYCQGIKMMCRDQLSEECRGFLQEAYNSTLRMNRLIEALLSFSRLRHVEPRREEVDLSDLARQVAKELRQAHPERQVEVRITDGVVAYGDADLLRVVLQNLFGNAWKYSGNQEKPFIEFGVTDGEEGTVYFVLDNGVGFDMAEADKLFIPFQRLSGTDKVRGFGIGLATVERIIVRHGGRIWAEGAPGKGARFCFTIPGYPLEP